MPRVYINQYTQNPVLISRALSNDKNVNPKGHPIPSLGYAFYRGLFSLFN
jgi:hypothetical protein